MELLLLPLFLSFLFLCFYFYISHSSKTKPTSTGFKNYPILGAIPEFLKNRRRFLDWSTEVLSRCPTNTAVFHRPGKVKGVITASPLNVEHILRTNFENYPKGDRFIMLLEDFLGRGIFNSDGDLWRVQRKTASYEFSTKSLRNFVMDSVKLEIESRLVPLLAEASRTRKVLDLQGMLERFAFDNICKLAFNVDPGCLDGDATSGGYFMRAFEDAATLSSERFMYAFPLIWKIVKLLSMGPERKLRKSIKIVHEFADEIIRSRMEQRMSHKDDEDLLSRFMGNDENSPEFLRDIIISFILAGRDTTSSALTWFFWQLSSNPDVETNILNELQMIRARNAKSFGEIYSLEELRGMHYLHAAITESMRLYPPVPVDTKACKSEDVWPDGTFVGKDWFVTYHTYAMGRMESLWGKDCGVFSPERWLENGVYRQESPFKFPVFHGGPRMCLGKDMAYIQMKSIAAAVIERFEIEVVEKEKCPEHVLSLTLRMKDGLLVKVKERCSAEERIRS